MATRITTVAFLGIEAVPVDVQVQISPGLPRFNIVGLPDKAVGESRERVRAALIASGLALPAKHISVNLAPADLPKEGTHYDLPIALGLMAAMGAIPGDMLERFMVLGELALDGRVSPVNHLAGRQMAARTQPIRALPNATGPDLADIRGQEVARRALEVAAAGGHNFLYDGPSGCRTSSTPIYHRTRLMSETNSALFISSAQSGYDVVIAIIFRAARARSGLDSVGPEVAAP